MNVVDYLTFDVVDMIEINLSCRWILQYTESKDICHVQ